MKPAELTDAPSSNGDNLVDGGWISNPHMNRNRRWAMYELRRLISAWKYGGDPHYEFMTRWMSKTFRGRECISEAFNSKV